MPHRFPLARTLLVLAACALLVMAAWPDAEAEESAYVRADTWRASLNASRARYVELYGRPQIALSSWRARGPLPAKSFAELHVDPAHLALDAQDAAGEPLWTSRPEWTDGSVHGLPRLDKASTYLHRTLEVGEALPRIASLGSDDGIEVWLNGKRLLSHDVPRGPAPGQEKVALDLKAGVNHLLLKIHNGAGGHGFYFTLENPQAAAVWSELEADFPGPCAWLRKDLPNGRHLLLFEEGEDAALSHGLLLDLFRELELYVGDLNGAFHALERRKAPPEDPEWLDVYDVLCRMRDAMATIQGFNSEALTRAVEDLAKRYPDEYDGKARRARVRSMEEDLLAVRRALAGGDRTTCEAAMGELAQLASFRREALLANPELDLGRLLVVQRKAGHLGLPQNWQGNCSLPRKGFDDRLVTLDPRDSEPQLTTFYLPEAPRQIADIDLDFDGERILFSMLGSYERWQIWELDVGSGEAVQVTPGVHADVDNYDACYLPDGKILFDSTRCFQGIPCVNGADQVANLYRMDRESGDIRQLCFDQDHDWCPTVLNNGRVLYTRWEYSDTPHYFSRLLFHMNPDGTGQSEYYGSNSYWPNTILYARPVPGHATQVVGIVSGHHGVPRMGELVLFDPAKGRFEADGVVQRIPGWGEEVEPVIADHLVNDSWPRFLHPWPLSSTHFLVSCQPSPDRPWGIYLVDVFDNVLCLAEKPGYALFEPTPLRARTRPPVIPDHVDLSRDDATIFLGDVYHGPGLAGVPRGTVKALRVYAFHYGYNRMGGHKHVGVEGPWDVHRILGEVPVYEDGSASFTVPANTPLAVQPLDAEGKALQVMRSWFTAMPGEVLSCTGCHEAQSSAPPVRPTLAARRAPAAIEPWYGPARGFSFPRDVQPVLDRHCVGCHDGRTSDEGVLVPDLRRGEPGWGNFNTAYLALHPYVRRPGPESDYHLQSPLEWHADTSELIQMLVRGHHGVELDEEAWSRLVTWIDLNVPDHGTWSEHAPIPAGLAERRRAMRAEHACRAEDPEEIVTVEAEPIAFVPPTEQAPGTVTSISIDGWPFNVGTAKHMQMESGLETELVLDLGEGVSMRLALVPTGTFVMGDEAGNADERPRGSVRIATPFYMGTFEVTREQFSRFDPAHHNGFHNQNHKDHTTPGYPANGKQRPVIRVSFDEAEAFCAWLSKRTGMRCTVPLEAEWEWACRAGAATPFSYGDLDSDFSTFANLSDRSTRRLAVTGVNPKPIPNPSPYEDWLPKDERFDDGQALMCDVGKYQPNAWGLYDMHGNVCEWTRSPYAVGTSRPPRGESTDRMVVRGGSWRDRPKNARSGWRWGYRPWQGVHNVGFRVVVYPQAERSR